jgi:hypothetical protein
MLTWLYMMNYDKYSTAVNKEKLKTSCDIWEICSSGDGHLSYGGSGGSNGQPGAGSSAGDFEMWS